MQQVNAELGISPTSSTISLNDSNVRALAAVPSGTISMDDLRGQSAFTWTGGTPYPNGFFVFTSSGPYSYTATIPTSIEVLIVAGGGNSTSPAGGRRGGGGGGGVRLLTIPVSSPGSGTITVGGGGSPSSAFGFTSTAGGSTGPVSPPSPFPYNGGSGGSGGGGSYPLGSGGSGNTPPTPVRQGYDGGDCLGSFSAQRGAGGGGGGDEAGLAPPNPNPFFPTNGEIGGRGGTGFPTPSIWNPLEPLVGDGTGRWGGGGGGSGNGSNQNRRGDVADGGGGIGGLYDPSPTPISPSYLAQNGQANTGGGAGGAGESPNPDVNGGSGVVIVRT